MARRLFNISLALCLCAGLSQCKQEQKAAGKNKIITPGGKTLAAEDADKNISTAICQRMVDCASKRSGKPAPKDAVSRCLKATKVVFDQTKAAQVKISEKRVQSCVDATKKLACKKIFSRSNQPPQACLQVTSILGALKKE